MIVVVGSINMDLVVRVERPPRSGETVLGSDYVTHHGGKGANQAVAAARAGGSVRMIGRVGSDAFGPELLAGLADEGIDISPVARLDVPSGVAFITVAADGQNSIIVAPGANGRLAPHDLERTAFEGARLLLLQLEIPLETALQAARLGREAGARVVLNLAPARVLGRGALEHVDLLLVNESEAATLLGLEPQAVGADPAASLERLSRLVPEVVLTLGGQGAWWKGRGDEGRVEAHRVEAVDTTAAGDAFAGALAVKLAAGSSLGEAVRFANAAGALAVGREGAQPSLPTTEEIVHLLKGGGG